ncbi:MAG: FkbM family methyltransferase [Propionibacteriaceae bacterium]
MARIIAGVQRAYHRGGVSELVLSGRRFLAAKIQPDPPPPVKAVKRPKPKSAVTPPAAAKAAPPTAAQPQVLLAESVSHQQALAWFAPRRPTYERLINSVAPYVDRTGLVLDVGANIGFFTKTFGELIDFSGTVHLFEPIPHLVELCRKTLSDVPYTAVVHDFGLGDQDAEITIYQAANGNLGWNTVVAPKANPDMQPLQIQVRAFDDIGIDGTPTFIKIDVEGAEYQVLKGMLGAIERWDPQPTILCEIGWGTGHPAWDEELKIFRALCDLGYSTLDLDHNPVDVETINKTTDLLFVPQHLI